MSSHLHPTWLSNPFLHFHVICRPRLNHVLCLMQYPVYFALHDDDFDNLLADIRKIASSGQPASATTGG
jgi:hypothetical protein